jgi:hypothetical protein
MQAACRDRSREGAGRRGANPRRKTAASPTRLRLPERRDPPRRRRAHRENRWGRLRSRPRRGGGGPVVLLDTDHRFHPLESAPPGATRRAGWPCSCESGSPRRLVEQQPAGVARVEAPAVAGVGDHAHVTRRRQRTGPLEQAARASMRTAPSCWPSAGCGGGAPLGGAPARPRRPQGPTGAAPSRRSRARSSATAPQRSAAQPRRVPWGWSVGGGVRSALWTPTLPW